MLSVFITAVAPCSGETGRERQANTAAGFRLSTHWSNLTELEKPLL